MAEKTEGAWRHVKAVDSQSNLEDNRDAIRPKTSDIPTLPGVYKWRDDENRVIYVGKAKNLRNRLLSYFQPLNQLHPRTQLMVLTARSLEWTVVATELEALTLEYTWIKAFNPRFNVVFRDDKTYPYLAVSLQDEFSRVWITRQRNLTKARYFGPYAQVLPLRQSLETLLKQFPVRTCSHAKFQQAHRTGRPCLLASIGKCSAPCVGRISSLEHQTHVEQLVGILSGNIGQSYVNGLTRDMRAASAALEFERAAKLRDEIRLFNTVLQQNALVLDDQADVDVFGLEGDEFEACIHAFFVRSGLIRGEKNWLVDRNDVTGDEELIVQLLEAVYGQYMSLSVDSQRSVDDTVTIHQERDALSGQQQATATDAYLRAQATRMRNLRRQTTGREDLLAPIAPIPREIIVPVALSQSSRVPLEVWLSELRGANVTIRRAERGEKHVLQQRACENAKQALIRKRSSRVNSLETRSKAMSEIAQALGMKSMPLRIECYDVANSADGSYQVASMVVFEDGMAKPSDYRHFSISDDQDELHLDDLHALYETLTRRFRHGVCERRDDLPRSERFAYAPQLVVVDGGRQQVLSAQRALEDCHIEDVRVCGLSKRLEELWIAEDEYPIILKRHSEGLYLLQRVRDESHRFAIEYHRKRRRKGIMHSELDAISGIGDVYRKRLLNKFGSLHRLKSASLQELQEVQGVGKKKALSIYQALHQREL